MIMVMWMKNYGLSLKARGRITVVLRHLNTTAKYIMTLLWKQTFLILYISIYTGYCNTTSSYTKAPLPDISPIAINCDGVAQLLSTLDVHKATGPDHIPSHLLKEISSEIAPSLTLIFKASLHQCSIPFNWKEVFIIPLFKKGDHSLPSNNCPLSLNSICCKLLEHN